MAGSIIKIKRSSTTAEPSLQVGELAYSWGTGTYDNGGERLYFGKVVGESIVPSVIGGAYFTQMLDHERGKLTASSAIIVDANKKIDQLKTTNITIGGDDVVTPTPNDIAANGGLRLNPSNNYVYIGSMYSLPTASPGTTGYVLTGNSDGTTAWSAPSTALYVSGNEGADITVDLLTETLEINGVDSQGIYTISYAGSAGYTGSNGNALNISARDASSSQKGVAKFKTGDFSVSSGEVTLGATVPRFFTTNNASYIGSNGATPNNGEIKIKGSNSNGIDATVVNGDTVEISGLIPSPTQRGTASFSDTYFYVGTAGSASPGLVSARLATNSTVGVAKFPDKVFTVGVDGAVDIKLATASGEGAIQGVASFNNTNFTVSTGVVTAKPVFLGTTELVLGEGVDVEGGANNAVTGLTSIEVGKLKLSGKKIEGFGNDTDIDIELSPKAAGAVKISDAYYLPKVTGTTGYVLTYKSDNTTEWKEASSKLRLRDNLGSTPVEINLLTQGIEFTGDATKGISASISNYYSGSYPGVNISARYAGYTGSNATDRVGVSSFYSDTFTIDAVGGVDVKSGGISNVQLANSSLTVGTTNISLGGTAPRLAGLVSTGYVGSLSIIGYEGSASTIKSVESIHLLSTGSALYQGYVKIGTEAWALPNGKGNADQVLTSDGAGSTAWASVPRVQYIDTDLNGYIGSSIAYVGSFGLGVDKLTLSGDGAIYTSFSSATNTIHIGVDTATNSNLGVAKFAEADFVVSVGGEVETKGEFLKSVSANSGTTVPYSHDLRILGYTGSATDKRAGAITTVGYTGTLGAGGAKLDIVARLASDTVTGVASFDSTNFTVTDGNVTSDQFTIGSTNLNLGGTTTTLTGLTSVTIDDIQIYDNIIKNANSNPLIDNADIILMPKGEGVVDVSGARISGVGTPTADTDAVTKLYADAMASGLDVKLSVRLSTTGPLIATASGQGYVGSNGAGNYNVLTNAGDMGILELDGFSVALANRVLVKDQGIVVVNGTKFAAAVTTTISNAAAISNNEITLEQTVGVVKGTKWLFPAGTTGITGLTPGTTYYVAENVVAGKKIKLSASYLNAISNSPTILTITGTAGGVRTDAFIGDNDAAKANGIYVVSEPGDSITNWVLTRADDADQTAEVNPGMFTFIEEGNEWADSGFILITDNPIVLGEKGLAFTQFSSAGRTLAGAGLEKVGDNININAGEFSGITVNADSIEISSTIAGNALNFTNGVLGVNFDNTTIGYTGSVTKNLRIHESYPGQTSITTVGTITTGTWGGTTIDIGAGGTGRTSISKGSILYGNGYLGSMSERLAGSQYQFLMIGGGVGASADIPVWSDIDGGEY